MTKRLDRFVFAVLASLVPMAATSCNATSHQDVVADIRYTSYGVPHIKAETFEGLGFGLAYAFAGENICLMAEQFVTLRGERAKYLGPDGFFRDMFAEALGEKVGNIDSDFYHKLIFSDVAERQKAGVSAELGQLVTGYVAGYNKYLADNQGHLPSACNGREWVRPITEDDMYRRFQQAQILGGSGIFVKPIADAMVREGDAGEVASVGGVTAYERRAFAAALRDGDVASNAIAFGRDLTPDGRGMMFGNPHFPWEGVERLYQMHLTIPGQYDIMGASLYGIPFPMIGFNRDIAWSLTWSTDVRFLIRNLALDAAAGSRYVIDDEAHEMTPVTITVTVRDRDGSYHNETRTAYKTAYGPLLGGKLFPQANGNAYALTDINLPNNRGIEGFFELTLAKRVEDFDARLSQTMGVPYSNVTGVDATGHVYYANKSVTVNVPDATVERCLKDPRAKGFRDSFAILILDGSTKACDPVNDPRAPQPGILPAAEKPFIYRNDYAAQTNDSHWIVNADPASYLSGFKAVIGPERTARGERLRTATHFIADRLAGQDGMEGNRMTPEHIRQIFYRAPLAEAAALNDELVADCESHPQMEIDGETVDVSDACAILKKWDGTESPDARGAQIFREFYHNLARPNGFIDARVWRVPFDAGNPLHTPYGYAASPLTRAAFAKAVKMLNDNGIPLDARLGDIQFVVRHGEKLSLSGGPTNFHRIKMAFRKGAGYTDPVLTGDSYIQAVHLGESGPEGYVVNAYSQSINPDSVHSYDQTVFYSQKTWPKIRFSDEEIEADPEYRLVHIEQ